MRAVRWFVAVLGTLAVAVLAAVWLVGPGGRPAAAAGLSMLCDGVGGSLHPIASSVVFEGDAITGEHHERTGFPASAIATRADPDGSPAITPGNLQPIDLDGDGQRDLELGLGVRTSTAPETVGSVTGATPMDALLTQNHGYRPDSAPSGTGVGVVGLDLLVKVPAASWINKSGHYAAQVRVRLDRQLEGRVVDHLDVKFSIDSLQAAARDRAARFPGEVRMSAAFKEPDVGDSDGVPDNDDIASWTVGQEVVYDGVALEDYGPLDIGATVTRVVPDRDGADIESGLVDVRLAWNRVPGDFALGVGQTCLPSQRDPVPVAHYASNVPQPASGGHDVDVAVRSGLGSGLDGGDEVRIEGRIQQLPRLVDLVARDGVVDLARSPDPSPNVRLDRLDLGVDDPDTDDDEPIHAHGRLDGLPPHVRVDHTRDEATGDLAKITVDACPFVDAVDPAITYLPALAPGLGSTGYVDGCSLPAGQPPVTIRGAHLVVQNFLPDGRHGREPSAALAMPPPPARPSEQVSHYERSGRGEAWELVTVVRPATARTTFVLAAAQHPHLGTTTDPDVLLVRAGADLTEVQSLTFEIEARSRRPLGTIPSPDDRTTYGARDTTNISTRAAPELRAQVTLQLDRRTDLEDEQANEGASAFAHGTIAPFPAYVPWLRVESLGIGTVENRDATALGVDWYTGRKTTLDLGVLRHQSPGRDPEGRKLPATMVDGEAELSAPVSGDLELAERARDGGQSSVLTYGQGPGDELDLRLAGRVTTESDRQAGRALRISGDARVTDDLVVTLDRAVDDQRLRDASAVACSSASRCDNDVHVDAVMGPDTSVPTLASGVTPPAPTPPVPWLTPRPAEPNNLTIVQIPAPWPTADEQWGASLDLHDLVELSYQPEPGDICVRNGNGTAGPVTALLQTPDTWSVGSDAWFDGRLRFLPAEAEAMVRFSPEADDDQPMLWVDTTSCDTDRPPVEETAPDAEPGADTAAGRPVIEATALAGCCEAVDALAPPLLNPRGDHVAVTAERTRDRTTAFAARIRTWLPDHLLVWAPDTACRADCTSPVWQHREHSGVRVRVQSTRRDLGPLTVAANVARRAGSCRATDSRWGLQASVPQVPGSFDIQASLRTTARLCSTDVELDAAGSTEIGDLTVTASDLAQPTDLSLRQTGYQGDAVGPLRTAVPELSLGLRDIDREVHVTARQRGFETPDAYPAPSGDLCPGHPAVSRGPANVGYLDASIDLSAARGHGTPAHDVVVDLVQARTDPRGTGDAQSMVTVNSDAPVDAVVQTRLNNLSQYISFTRSDPIPRGLGLLLSPLVDAFAPGIGPLALSADAFLDDADLDACLDFDLPLVLTLKNTRTAQLAQAGVSFGLDDDGAGGTVTTLDVGELMTSAAGTPTLRAGAPYAHRSVDFDSGSTTTSSGVVTNTWKDIVAVPTGTASGSFPACGGRSIRYFPGIPTTGGALGTNSLFTGVVAGTSTARDGTTSGVGLRRAFFDLDLLWNAVERAGLASLDLSGASGCPGVSLYNGLGALSTPPTSLPLAFTPATPVAVQEAEYTITQADALAAGSSFCSLGGWSTAVADRPAGSPGPDYPVAVGADGTRYTLEIWTADPSQTYCRINLVARHPSGALRWSRRIANDAGPIAFWPLDWTVRILPRGDDGSVELQMLQHDLRPRVPPTRDRIWLQVFDASGNGQVIMGGYPDVGAVQDLLEGTPPDLRLGVPEVQSSSQCTFEAASPAEIGTTRVWYFGDGYRYVDPPETLEPHDVTHCHDRAGDYYVQVVDFRHITTNDHTRTEITDSRRWRVHVPS